jgi:hypothetical protein
MVSDDPCPSPDLLDRLLAMPSNDAIEIRSYLLANQHLDP